MKLLLNSVQTPHGTGLTPVQPNPTVATKSPPPIRNACANQMPGGVECSAYMQSPGYCW